MTLRTTQTKNEMLSKKEKWGMGQPLNFWILHKYNCSLVELKDCPLCQILFMERDNISVIKTRHRSTKEMWFIHLRIVQYALA